MPHTVTAAPARRRAAARRRGWVRTPRWCCSAARGEGLPLDRWLREVMWPREARLTPEDVEVAMTAASGWGWAPTARPTRWPTFVRSGAGRHVRNVWVRGRAVVRDGAPTTVDVEALRTDVAARAARLTG